MRFPQRVVNLEGTHRRGSPPRQCLARWGASVLFHHRVAVGESRVSEGIGRVFIHCLLKLLERSLQPASGPPVPVVAPPQIELICLQIPRWFSRDRTFFGAGKLRLQCLSDRFCDLAFDSKNVSQFSVVRFRPEMCVT